MKITPLCRIACLLILAAAPAAAQITIDSDRTITNLDAADLALGFTVNNGAVLTIAPGTTVNVNGPANIGPDGRMVVVGTLAEPIRLTFGAAVIVDYRPEVADGIGLDLEHAVMTVVGSFESRHGSVNGYLGGAFPAVSFKSSIVEVRGPALGFRELNYVGESTLFFGATQLLDISGANTQFTDCVFIRRSRPTANLSTAANSIIATNGTAGEHLFQNVRFSGSSVIRSFNDVSFRFVNCDFSDSIQSFHNAFSVISLTFENSIVTPVDNASRANQSYTFTSCYPDLLPEDLVLNTVESTTITITDPLADPPFRSADVNNDGVVSATDVNTLMDIVVGNTLASSLDFPDRADADGNGTVDERDVAVLRAFVDGVLPQLPEVVAP